MVDVFKEGKFELLALTETTLKGKGEVLWCGVSGIIAGVEEMERASEGVAILLKDVWHSALVDFGCVSSRILWIKFKFSKDKVCMMVGYGPNEGGEESDRFLVWRRMKRKEALKDYKRVKGMVKRIV